MITTTHAADVDCAPDDEAQNSTYVYSEARAGVTSVANSDEVASSPRHLGLIVNGPLTMMERVALFERMRKLCRGASEPVRRVALRATVNNVPGNHVVVIDSTIELSGARLIVAGAVECTFADALRELTARVARRLDAPVVAHTT